MNKTTYFTRLKELQSLCFSRGKRRWAKSLGAKLKDFVSDNPQFRNL